MKVILLERIGRLGSIGDEVTSRTALAATSAPGGPCALEANRAFGPTGRPRPQRRTAFEAERWDLLDGRPS